MTWVKPFYRSLWKDTSTANIWVNWRHTCRRILRQYLEHTAFLFDTMGKSKEISQDIRKEIVQLYKSGSSLWTSYRCLKVLRSFVRTVIYKYRHNGNVQPSYCSERRQVLCPEDEWIWVQNVQQKPKTLSRFWLKLVNSVIIHSQIVLYWHGLKRIFQMDKA